MIAWASDRYLTLEDLLALVEDLRVGPIRDIGLLNSAAHRPRVTVLAARPTQTSTRKPPFLLESLLRNHALVDGNKRLGWLSVVVFYGLSDIGLDAPDDDAYDLVMAMAGGAASHPEAASRLTAWH